MSDVHVVLLYISNHQLNTTYSQQKFHVFYLKQNNDDDDDGWKDDSAVQTLIEDPYSVPSSKPSVTLVPGDLAFSFGFWMHCLHVVQRQKHKQINTYTHMYCYIFPLALEI